MNLGLRTRAVLTLLAVVIPISLGFSYYRWHIELNTVFERYAERTVTQIHTKPDRTCNAPKDQNLTRRGFHIYTYAQDLTPTTPDAPALPTATLTLLQQNPETPVHLTKLKDSRYRSATAIQLEHSPDCAVALVAWPGKLPHGAPSLVTRALFQGLALLISLTAVGLLISAPLVFRLRRLSEAVRNATDQQFHNPEPPHKNNSENKTKDEIAELAHAFDTTFTAFHNRDAALKEYIANTTHDLAIPLTVLQHKLTALRPHLPPDDTLAHEHIDTALEESHYIASLIANMSAAAKLEVEHVHQNLAPVNLNEIVTRVAARHRPIAAQKNIALNFSTPETPVFTPGDATLVEQAFSNLVQNAVQYNNPNGHVSIILEHEPNDSFQFRVIDDGPGVPINLSQQLLQRGIRTDDARNRNSSGQGFGLAITQQVCTRHNWSLTLQPLPDHGTQATIQNQSP